MSQDQELGLTEYGKVDLINLLAESYERIMGFETGHYAASLNECIQSGCLTPRSALELILRGFKGNLGKILWSDQNALALAICSLKKVEGTFSFTNMTKASEICDQCIIIREQLEWRLRYG